MARPLYSTSFFIGSVAVGTVDLVPLLSTFRYVIRDVTVFLESEDAFSVFLHVDLNGNTILKFSVTGFERRTYHWSGRIVVPGDTLVALQCFGTTGFTNVAMSGYQLTLP